MTPIRMHSTCSAWPKAAAVIGSAWLLAACAAGKPADTTPPPIQVSAAMPARHVFHAKVTAFGQLVANTRQTLVLSLPQAGQVSAIRIVAGQRVSHGEALLALVTDPTARSAYLQAQSAVKLARDDLAQVTRLQTEKLATTVQVEAARKALIDAQAALRAQAALGGADRVATLRAPVGGVVTAVDVQAGQRIAAGVPVIHLSPGNALVAQLGVAPDEASSLRVGMHVALRPVYAAPGAKALAGTVAVIGDAVSPSSHLVDVIAAVDRPVALPAGSALSAVISTRPITAWAVPRDALQSDAQGHFVYQVEHGKARRVDVKVRIADGSPVGVDGQIDPRAPVITLGSYEVSNDDPVVAKVNKAAGP